MRLAYTDYWEIHHRRSLRLRERNYTASGMYFVTICTLGRDYLFGDVVKHEMQLNDFGKIVHDCWINLPNHFSFIGSDAFVIMPNHVHGIIRLDENANSGCRGKACLAPTSPMQFQKPPAHSLCSVIGSFKSAATKHINIIRGSPGEKVWQRNYYERVIRGGALNDIRRYIKENPKNWHPNKNRWR